MPGFLSTKSPCTCDTLLPENAEVRDSNGLLAMGFHCKQCRAASHTASLKAQGVP